LVAVFIEVLLAAILFFLPAVLGGVEAWTETVALAVVLLLVGLAIVRSLRTGGNPWLNAVSAPVVGFVAVVWIQLLNLTPRILERISPAMAGMRRGLAADLANGPAITAGATLSFYPHATRHDLRIILIAVGIFFVVLEVYRTPRQIRRLLTTVASIGAASAILALLQDFAGNGKIYWVIPSAYQATCGSFVNYSNFSQFMNLSTGATLGLLLVKLQEFTEVHGGEGHRQSVRSLTPDRFRSFDFAVIVGLATSIVLSFMAVCLSLSRGGILSMISAAAFATVLIARRRLRAQGWILLAVVMIVFGSLLYAGFDTVYDRLATLYNRNDPTSGRFQTYRDLLLEWRRFPLWGTGLGTHRWIYPMFDRSHDPALAAHADCDWLQLLEESGILGVGIVIWFVGVVAYHFLRVVRLARSGVGLAAIGLGFGLVAVMLNSITDFGQHVPAVAGLSAISCGIIVNLSRLQRSRRSKHESRGYASSRGGTNVHTETDSVTQTLASRWLGRGWLVAITSGLIWALIGAAKRTAAAAVWERANEQTVALQANRWQGSDEQYRAVLIEASRAVALDADNVEYRYGLNALRWYAISRPTEQYPEGRTEFSPQALGYARQIVEDLHATRALCPTFGLPMLLAGQIELSVLDDARGKNEIRLAYRVYPNHPDVAMANAMLDAEEGKWQDSKEKFEHALDLNPGLFTEIAVACISQFHNPGLAITIARDRDDVTELLQVLRRLDQTAIQKIPSTATQRAVADAINAFRSHSVSDEAFTGQLRAMADLCLRQGDEPAAIGYFKRAVAKNYSDVSGHLELAKLLSKHGHTMEAVDHLRICLRLQPGMNQARQLLGDLSLRPDFIPGG
jgi:tetratricopeptide (TPR) repeat protein